MSKSTLAIVGVVVIFIAFLGAAVVFKKNQTEELNNTTGTVPTLNREAGDWVSGAGTVTVIEYSDFECPACRNWEPIIKNVMQKFEGKVALVYRHFPLPMHSKAMPAAYASEAAGVQGKFWEMHKILFERQTAWVTAVDSKSKFVEYAKELGLDENKFLADYDSADIKNKVRLHLKSGYNEKVNATPTFFVNGKKFAGGSEAELSQMIEEAVNQSAN